tara:strand:- start:438 stop:629 length:192 start_codon:yes stop_codon:yes gene_type:complete
MEKLITDVLEKYRRKNLTPRDLAMLIVAHIKVGINGKKGWYLDLSDYAGQYEKAKDIIKEFEA